jgi:serine/threonine protein kinase
MRLWWELFMSDNDKLIGKCYKILQKIGEGGMGVVYRVVDRLNGLLMALKQVKIPPGELNFNTTDTE